MTDDHTWLIDPVEAFSALRMFALSGRNWWLSALVAGLSLVPFAVNLVSWATMQCLYT